MKKQSGGLFKQISHEIIDNWMNPHTKKMDCCPCVFNMLGIVNDEDMKHLVKTYGDSGMFQKNIILFFKKKYKDYNFSFAEAIFRGESSSKITDTIRGMYQYIPKGYGMVGAIERENGSGHCVVYSRDINNKPCIFDSQLKKTYMDGKKLQEFFVGNRVHKIMFLQSKHKTDKRPLKIDKEGISENFYDAPNIPKDVFFDTIDDRKGKSKRRSKRRSQRRSKRRSKRKSQRRSKRKSKRKSQRRMGSSKKSLKRAKILSGKEYNELIKKRKSKKKITKDQNKRLDHTLFIKYCNCVKHLKYSKKKKDNLEYPICTSSVYTKRGFKPPKDIRKRCKEYR